MQRLFSCSRACRADTYRLFCCTEAPKELEEVEEVPKPDEALKDAAVAGKQAIKEAVGKGDHDASMPEKEEWKDIIARSTERVSVSIAPAVSLSSSRCAFVDAACFTRGSTSSRGTSNVA